jgi:hypothetical protein
MASSILLMSVCCADNTRLDDPRTVNRRRAILLVSMWPVPAMRCKI